MSEKKSFVLRLDESMYKLLEKWATDEFRSVNGQLEWIIQQQLKASGRWKNNENSEPAPPAARKKNTG